MAENIAKYGISLEFDKALKGLKKFKAEAKKLNNMQMTMNRSQKKLRQRGMSEALKAEETLLADSLKRRDKMVRERDKKSQMTRSNKSFKESVLSLTPDSGVKDLNAYYKAQEKLSDKAIKREATRQQSISSARTKQAVGDITAPTGAEGMRDYYKQLSKDADEHWKKVKTHQSDQKKAMEAYWRDQRKKQEQLGAAMAKDANEALRAQKAKNKALERAKEAVMTSALMQERETTAARKAVQHNIKNQIAKAKTAQEVRRIVASERASLKITEKKSFLMRRMESSSQQMLGNMASMFAIGATGAFVTRTGQDFEAVSNTMLAVSKDSKQAGENLEFVRGEAYRLGLGLKESAKGFAKMNAARGDMSLEDTKKAFTGISEMSTLLGLSAEESSRSINALQQIGGLAS